MRVRQRDSSVLPLRDRGIAANPRWRFGPDVASHAVPNAKVGRLGPSALAVNRAAQIAVDGAPQRVVTRIGRQLGLLWIFRWSLPFFRMQSGRSHNCLTKLLERHLCTVCARRSFF